MRPKSITSSAHSAVIGIMLPVVDGLSIVKAMRTKGVDVSFIMLTALGAVEDRVAGLNAGEVHDERLAFDAETRSLCVGEAPRSSIASIAPIPPAWARRVTV